MRDLLPILALLSLVVLYFVACPGEEPSGAFMPVYGDPATDACLVEPAYVDMNGNVYHAELDNHGGCIIGGPEPCRHENFVER